MTRTSASPPTDRTPRGVLLTAGAIALLAAAFVLTKTGRDSLYFQADGLRDLPGAYIGIALGSLPFSMGVVGLMRRFGPRPVRVAGPLAIAAIQLAFLPFVHPGGGALMTAFFMLVPIAYGVGFSVTWLLAAEILEGTPRESLARPYGIIGAASILGGVAGGALARIVSPFVDPPVLILLGAGTLVLVSLVILGTQRLHPDPSPSHPRGLTGLGLQRYSELLREPYPLMLLAVALFASLSKILIDFQFYLAAATSGHAGRENAEFFAGFYMMLNGAALLVQVAAMPRLQRWLGVRGSLLVLPGILLGGVATLFATGSLVARAALRITEGGIKSSIHRANWEQAYLPLDPHRRTLAKILVDGVGARLGEGIAAVIVLVWLTTSVGEGDLAGRETGWVTPVLLASVAIWFLLSRRVGDCLEAYSSGHPKCVPPDLEIPVPDT